MGDRTGRDDRTSTSDLANRAAEVVRRYWAAANERDWTAFGALVARDVVYELPQTRERIRGWARYVEFNATYPGNWRVAVERVVGDGRHAVSWTTFIVDDSRQTGLCFFDLDEHGLICHISDFWPQPYQPPPGREHLTERY